MSTLVTRAGKGSPLTHNEVDTNFNNLNTDKIESGNTVAALTITSASVVDLAVTGITSFDGSQGTAGQVLTSAGTGATPTWAAASGGGQFFGSAAIKAIAYNSNTIGENVTVTTGNSGLSAGPITISSGFAVTVASGSRWVVL